jgi:hypothetical protein
VNKPLHLIFIPGLGDQNPSLQRRAVNTWRWWGAEAELLPMHWADKEPWAPKFRRLLKRIDELDRAGKAIALVGASAGATAVINAYAARPDKIVGCVLIAGKVNRPDAIGQRYRDENPAFITSAYDCHQALKTLDAAARRRILSRYALFDETVYRPDSRIPGAHNRTVPTIGHVPTIATQITLGAPSFIHFLKHKQPKTNV